MARSVVITLRVMTLSAIACCQQIRVLTRFMLNKLIVINNNPRTHTAMHIEVTRAEFEEILNAMKIIRNMLHKEKLSTTEVENIIAKLDAIKERS